MFPFSHRQNVTQPSSSLHFSVAWYSLAVFCAEPDIPYLPGSLHPPLPILIAHFLVAPVGDEADLDIVLLSDEVYTEYLKPQNSLNLEGKKINFSCS